jgi:hypothetical protein
MSFDCNYYEFYYDYDTMMMMMILMDLYDNARRADERKERELWLPSEHVFREFEFSS